MFYFRLLLGQAALLAAVLGEAQAPFDLDPGFQTPFMTTGSGLGVNSVLPLPDGDVIVSGPIKFSGDPSARAGGRLNSDGTRDLAFAEYPLMGGKLIPWNGRIYAGNGLGVRRLWMDGTLDPDFDMAGSPYFAAGQGGDYHVYPDGRVLMSGLHDLFDTIRGYVGLYSLIWFQNTGYVDTTAHHRNCNGVIYRFEPQPDGKFVCSGWQTTYEGQAVHQIFRVQPDGALDTTFQTDFTWGEANDFTVLDDGRIIASGYLKRDGLPDTLRLIRMLPDGTLDPTFNNALSAPDSQNPWSGMQALRHTVLDDGRIVLHGNYDSIDGEPRVGIAMLDADGYLINDYFAEGGCGDYDTGTGNAHATSGMTQAPDGSWYIHGSYSGYDDGTNNYPNQRFVSRLYGLDVGVEEQVATDGLQIALSANPASGTVHLSWHMRATFHGNAQLTVVNSTGVREKEHVIDLSIGSYDLDIHALAPGIYHVHVAQGGTWITGAKLVVE
jgi:uncharacterized delta-60 repeat protein